MVREGIGFFGSLGIQLFEENDHLLKEQGAPRI